MVARVLVTGATGFIGQHLIPLLLQNGHQPIILMREQYAGGQGWPPALKRNRQALEVVYADLRNFALTARAVVQANPTHVIHLAAAGATDPFLPINSAIRHNLYGTTNLLRACFEKPDYTRNQVEQLLLCRTPGELAAMNVYATSKLSAWNFCQMYARTQRWPIVGAMIFQTFGIGQRSQAVVPAAFAAAQNGQDFPMTSGTQRRDWIYVGDVVQAILAGTFTALEPGTTFDVGMGQSTAVIEIVEAIYKLVAGPGKPRPGLLPTRPGEVPVQCADIERTTTLTGWQPTVSLTDGLGRMLGDLKAQQAAQN